MIRLCLYLYYYNYICIGCQYIDFDQDQAELKKKITIQCEKIFEDKSHLAKHQFGFRVLNVKIEQIQMI